jgi:hypothetical protein
MSNFLSDSNHQILKGQIDATGINAVEWFYLPASESAGKDYRRYLERHAYNVVSRFADSFVSADSIVVPLGTTPEFNSVGRHRLPSLLQRLVDSFPTIFQIRNVPLRDTKEAARVITPSAVSQIVKTTERSPDEAAAWLEVCQSSLVKTQAGPGRLPTFSLTAELIEANSGLASPLSSSRVSVRLRGVQR